MILILSLRWVIVAATLLTVIESIKEDDNYLKFCGKLDQLDRNCNIFQNPLCQENFISRASTENYSSACNTDSPFTIDFIKLNELSLNCKHKGAAKTNEQKYLWTVLFVKNDARNTIEWMVW
jgi:hypothetical protein